MKEKEKVYTKDGFWLCVAIVVFLINQLPFLVDMRPVMYDEAWYGDTAYNLINGHGFRNAIVGTRGNSNFLLPLMTATFMSVFGTTLFAIRITAVFCGLVTLLFLFLSMKHLGTDWKTQALTFLFFVSTTIYNTIFRFGRPECAALMCMAGGLWFYLRYRDKATWTNMLGLSVFVYLAGCAHPYALLMFALLGVVLLMEAIKAKDKNGTLLLLMLLMAAVLAVVSISYVSKLYNGAEESYVKDRFSIKGIAKAVPVYFKGVFFSKSALFMLPLLAVLVCEVFSDKENRTIAVVALAHFLIFPFLFSSDLMMVGLGQDYVVLVSTVLLAPFIHRLLITKKNWMVVAFVIYCLGNIGISYYYNYGVKYEKANSVLAKELPSIVPRGSKVFGPIRQWPMLMETEYQSDHTIFPVEDAESYDYIVFNTLDTTFFDVYKRVLSIDKVAMKKMYEYKTKNYGVVIVFMTPKKSAI